MTEIAERQAAMLERVAAGGMRWADLRDGERREAGPILNMNWLTWRPNNSEELVLTPTGNTWLEAWRDAQQYRALMEETKPPEPPNIEEYERQNGLVPGTLDKLSDWNADRFGGKA
jgi:hypothetical protein